MAITDVRPPQKAAMKCDWDAVEQTLGQADPRTWRDVIDAFSMNMQLDEDPHDKPARRWNLLIGAIGEQYKKCGAIDISTREGRKELGLGKPMKGFAELLIGFFHIETDSELATHIREAERSAFTPTMGRATPSRRMNRTRVSGDEDEVSPDSDMDSPHRLALMRADKPREDYDHFTIDRTNLDKQLVRDNFIEWKRLLPLMRSHIHLKGEDAPSQEAWELFVDEVCNRGGDLVRSEDRIRIKLCAPKPVEGFGEALQLYLDVPASDLLAAHVLQSQTGKEAEVHEDETPRLQITGLETGAGLDGGASQRRAAARKMFNPLEPVPLGANRFQAVLDASRKLRGDTGRTD